MTISVALLFGGRSGEHGISCVTAGGFLAAIDRTRYDVVAVGITREGRYVVASTDPSDWVIRDGRAPEVPAEGIEVLLPAGVHRPGTRSLLRQVRDGRVEPFAEIDIVLPLLHGPYGEDGTVQGLLDLLDVPYAGSGVLASATCMDKTATKAALAAAGIASAPGVTLHEDEWATAPEEVARTISRTLELPWFVKPARAGSSLGVSRVEDPAQLEAALRTAFAVDPKILVEQGVVGREVECGVLEGAPGQEPRTTFPGEVKVGDDLDFYDYESKYFGKGTIEIEVPADLPAAWTEEVRAVAARSFRALGLEGLARVDVFVTPDGAVVVNEVNTMPGFTPFSMFPVLWANMGLAYPDLIAELIELGRARRVGLR